MAALGDTSWAYGNVYDRQNQPLGWWAEAEADQGMGTRADLRHGAVKGRGVAGALASEHAG